MTQLIVLLYAWKTRHHKRHPSRDYAYRFVAEHMPPGQYKFYFRRNGTWEARRL